MRRSSRKPVMNRNFGRLLALVAIWYTSSAAAILVTKALFLGRLSIGKPFGFPLTITTSSNIVSGCLAAIVLASSAERVGGAAQHRYAQVIGGMTAFEIGLSNWALNKLTVALSTMLKGTAPLLVMGWGIALGIYVPRVRTLLVVLAVAVGLALAVGGQRHTQESVHALKVGVTATLFGGLLSGLRWVITQLFVKGEASRTPTWLTPLIRGNLERPLSAVAVIRLTAPYTAAVVGPCALALEGRDLLSWFGNSSILESISAVMTAVGVGCCVFVLLWAEYALVKCTSSLTVSIGFVAKEVITIGAGVVIFGDQLTLMSVFGFLLVQVGIFVYAMEKQSMANDNLPTHQSVNGMNQRIESQ